MKARSKKFLSAAVAAAATALSAVPAVKAQTPILYELSATSSTQVTSNSAGNITFSVLALTAGTDSSQANDGFVSGQFSLVQNASGITGGALTFTLSSAYAQNATAGSTTATFGSVPTPSNGNVGSSTPTGSANDTIIGYTGISNSGPTSGAAAYSAEASGTVVDPTGATSQVYNIFNIGTGTLTVPAQALTGSETDSISLVPRGGLGTLIKPQVAYIDGALQAYRGDNTANVKVVAPLAVTTKSSVLVGDMNGDGFIDSNDIDPFGEALLDPSQYEADFHLDPNVVGDINGDGFFDSNDIDPFGALILSGGASLEQVAALEGRLQAVTEAVPEPMSIGLLAMGLPLLAGRRRRR